MTAEPLLALPRPAQSGRVSSPRPARLNRDPARTPGLAHPAGTSVQPAGSGQPPAPARRYGQFAFDDPFPSGRILDAKWTRTPAIGPHPQRQKPTNCRQSPLSDSNRRPLPYHGRVRVSRAFTDALERARNPCKRGKSECTAVVPGIRPMWIWWTENGRKLRGCARRPVDRLRSTSVGSPAQRDYSRIARIRQSRPALSLVVQPGRARSARAGACSVYESDSAGALAARHRVKYRQAPSWPEVGGGVAPEFMPKRNSGPIRRRGQMGDDAALSSLANLRACAPQRREPCSSLDALLLRSRTRATDRRDARLLGRPLRAPDQPPGWLLLVMQSGRGALLRSARREQTRGANPIGASVRSCRREPDLRRPLPPRRVEQAASPISVLLWTDRCNKDAGCCVCRISG